MSSLLTPPPFGPSPDYRKRSFHAEQPSLESLGLPDLLPDTEIEPAAPEPSKPAAAELPAIDEPPPLESLGLIDLTKAVEPPPAISAEFMPLSDVPPENKLGQSIQNWRTIHSRYGGSGASPGDAQYWIERVPFAGAVGTAVNLGLVKRAMDNVQSGKGSDDDYSRLGQFIAEEEAKGQQKGITRSAFDVLSHLPGFAFEFWVGGGLARGALGVGAKALGKDIAETAAKTAVTSGLKAGATAAAKTAGFEGLRAAFMPQRIAESASRRMMDEFRLTEDEAGRIGMEIKRAGDSLPNALGKGALDTYIEALSERSGAATVGAFKKATGTVYSATFGRTGPGRALSDYLMRKWLAVSPGRTPAMYAKALRELGQDGLIGELVEERLGEVARGATGLEEGYGVTGGLLSGGEAREQALRQLMIEAAAFAVPSAPGIVGSTVRGAKFAAASPVSAEEARARSAAETPVTGNISEPVSESVPVGPVPATTELPPSTPKPAPGVPLSPDQLVREAELQRAAAEPAAGYSPGRNPSKVQEQAAQPRATTGAIGNLSDDDVRHVFAGADVTRRDTGDGWRVKFSGGRHVDVMVRDTVPTWDPADEASWATVEKAYGRAISPEERSTLRARGKFVVNTGRMQADALGLIFLNRDLATQGTLTHEAVHLGRQAGFFSEDEWKGLVRSYSAHGRSGKRQEEDIARGIEKARAEKTPEGNWFLQRITAGIRKLLSAFGADSLLGLNDRQLANAEAVFGKPEFWSRAATTAASKSSGPPQAEPGTRRSREDEPPRPPGTVRFYHGGVPGEGARWLSEDRSYAEGYASKAGEGAIVQYVDIPEDSPLLQKSFDDTGTSMKSPYVNFEAPAEIMAQAKPLAQVAQVPAESAPTPETVRANTAPAGTAEIQPETGASASVRANTPDGTLSPETIAQTQQQGEALQRVGLTVRSFATPDQRVLWDVLDANGDKADLLRKLGGKNVGRKGLWRFTSDPTQALLGSIGNSNEFEAFAQTYREGLKNLLNLSIDINTRTLWAARLGMMSDEHPDWIERIEAEIEAEEKHATNIVVKSLVTGEETKIPVPATKPATETPKTTSGSAVPAGSPVFDEDWLVEQMQRDYEAEQQTEQRGEPRPTPGSKKAKPRPAGKTDVLVTPAEKQRQSRELLAAGRFSEGDRVRWTQGGKQLTGTVRGLDMETGQLSVNTDQIEVVGGGVPIGRIEYPLARDVEKFEPAETKSKAARRPTEAAADVAKQEMLDAFAELRKALQSKGLASNPFLDPDYVRLAAKAAIASVKYGITKFADFVSQAVEIFGVDKTRQMGELLRRAWDAAGRHPNYQGKLDSSSEIDAILGEPTHVETEQTSEQGAAAGSAKRRGRGAPKEHLGAGGRAGAGSRPADRDAGDDHPRTRTGEEAEGPAAGRPAVLEGREGERDVHSARNVRLDHEEIGRGGPKQKYRDNVAAIQLYQQIRGEGRTFATPEEQAVLAKYVGWGMFPGVFNDLDDAAFADLSDEARREQDPNKWAKERDAIRELLSAEEWESARNSTINAHYTSPQVVLGMWRMAGQMGFSGGRVLETSAGIGNFIGLQPDEMHGNSEWTAVELDKLTGGMLKLLYPQANVQVKGYQHFDVPDNFYDMAIGNVPFSAEVRILSDDRYKKLSPPLHDYFFLKSIDKVRPGGLVMFITSTGTLDKGSKTIRRALAEKADLVQAIRLPENTFDKNAGTAVVTDLIVLRKREPGAAKSGPAWMELKEVPDPDGGPAIPINEYYADHPEQVLGTVDRKSRLYGKGQPHVSRTEDFADRWSAAISRVPVDFYTAETHPVDVPQVRLVTSDEHRDGQFVVENGKLYAVRNGALAEVTPPAGSAAKSKGAHTAKLNRYKKQLAVVRDVAPVRAAVRRRIAEQISGEGETAAGMQTLREAYERFVKAHGPLNGKKVAEALWDDVEWPVLAALEFWDEDSHKVTGLADIFTKDTISGRKAPTSAATVSEAVALVLDAGGRIDVNRIAWLTGREAAEVEKELVAGNLAYHDPSKGWQTADIYLSGNVRQKLREARMAAEVDRAFEPNIKALEAIQPKDIPSDDIHVRAGATWIPVDIVRDFLVQITGGQADHFDVVRIEETGETIARLTNAGDRYHANNAAVRQIWGTSRAPLIGGRQNIFDALLEGSQISIYDEITVAPGQTQRVLNPEATEAARTKVEELAAEFTDWLWSDKERRESLTRRYNELHNAVVLPKYDGGHLTFPGMAAMGTVMRGSGRAFAGLRPHQRNAVWRAIIRGKALFAHEVGTGKTYTLVAAAMEMRRLGLARKPVILVKNAQVDAIAQDARDLYPAAKVLVAARDMDSASRKETVAKITTGDWDLIVLTHDNFKKISLSDKLIREYVDERMALIREMLVSEGVNPDDAKGIKSAARNNSVVKRLAAQKLKLDEKLHALAHARRDDNVNFEELGVDLLLVDEAHVFKSLAVHTRMGQVKGLPSGDSDFAENLDLVSGYLQRRHNGRGLILATGTPVTNSMAELYVMQHYVQKPELAASGLTSFDAWASVFGETVTKMEFDHTGGVKQNTRFSRFINLPELRLLAFEDLDYVRAEDDPALSAALNRPKRNDREIVLEGSELQSQYLAALGARAKLLKKARPEKGGDNHLRIASDGKKAAMDLRLVIPGAAEEENSKARALTKEVLRIHRNHPGSTQMVFFEAGRSTSTGFDMGKDIIDKLVREGIPRDKILDFRSVSAEKKEAMVKRLKSGDAWIAIGGTKTLGTGVNAQDHLRAIHHLEPAWTPEAIEQRNGRGWRQGNQNSEIDIITYLTTATLDSWMWQTVAAKDRFIKQFFAADVKARSVDEEDIDEQDYSDFERMQVLSSGNPLLYEQMNLVNDINRLDRSKIGNVRQKTRLKESLADSERELSSLKEQQERVADDRRQYESTRDDDFAFTPAGGGRVTDRKEAARELYRQSLKHRDAREGTFVLGEFRGFDVVLRRGRDFMSHGVTSRLALGRKGHYESDKAFERLTSENPEDVWADLVRVLSTELRYASERLPQRQKELGSSIETIREDIRRPWRDAKKLKRLKNRLSRVQDAIAAGLTSTQGLDYQTGQLVPKILDRAHVVWARQGGTSPSRRTPGAEDFDTMFSLEWPEDEHGLVRLMQQVEHRTSSGALVPARELRKAAKLPKNEFDRAILELARQGVVSLHRHDQPAALSEAQRAELVHDPAAEHYGHSGTKLQGTFYVGMALRVDRGQAFSLDVEDEPKMSRMLREKLGRLFSRTTIEPPTDLRADNPDVEARLQAARGVPDQKFTDRMRLYWDRFIGFFGRAQLNLPNTAQFARFNEMFRNLRGLPSLSLGQVSALMRYTLEPIQTHGQMYLLERKVLYEDLLRAFDELNQLKFGFQSRDEIAGELAKVDALIEKSENAPVREALARREATRKAIVQRLVNEKMLPEAALDNPAYFHRIIVSKLLEAHQGLYGTASGIRAKKRGFQKRRSTAAGEAWGPEYDHNTNFLEAESQWMADALSELNKAELRKKYLDAADRMKAFRRDAKRLNYVAAVGGQENMDRIEQIRAEMAELREQEHLDSDDRKTLKALSAELWELDPTMPQRQKMAMFMGKLKKEIEGLDESERRVEEIRKLANSPKAGIRGPARGFLKALSAREQVIREKAGREFVTPDDLLKRHNSTAGANERLAAWLPRKDGVFYPAWTLPERIVAQIQQQLEDTVKLTPDDLRLEYVKGRTMAMILPERLVRELERLDIQSAASRTGLAQAKRVLWDTPQRWMKTLLTHAPWNMLRYTTGNVITDLSIITADHGILTQHVRRAAREMWQWHKLGKLASRDVNEAWHLGVIGSGQTAGDILKGKDVAKLAEFERFWNGTQKNLALARKVAGYVTGPSWGWVSELRENTVRYAAYLYYKQRLNAGTLSYYGGAKKEVVDQLKKEFGAPEAAAHLARNLFGDYLNVSEFGRVAKNLFPFYAWTDTVLFRSANMLRNAVLARDPKAGASVAWLVGSKLAAFYVLQWLWNNVLWGDDEEKLGAYDRQNPHVIVGHSDDQIYVLRNAGLFGELASYFGGNEALSLIGRMIAERGEGKPQVTLTEILAVLAKGLPNKAYQSLSPLAKAPIETATGETRFPDVLEPRTQPRDELLSQALDVRDQWLYVKSFLKEGDRTRPDFWKRLAVGVNVAQRTALEDMYDARDRFLESKHKPVDSTRTISQYRKMRHAIQSDSFDQFREARSSWIRENPEGSYRGFRRFLDTLDPIASRISDEDEIEFEREFLTSRQRTQLNIARTYAAELKVRGWLWWKRATATDSPEERERFARDEERELVSKIGELGLPAASAIGVEPGDAQNARDRGITVAQILIERRGERRQKLQQAENWFRERLSDLGTARIDEAAVEALRRRDINPGQLGRMRSRLRRLQVNAAS